MGRTEREIIDYINAIRRVHWEELEPLYKELAALRALQSPTPLQLPRQEISAWLRETLKRDDNDRQP